ncbi:MAG: transposase [Verrucomicrobiae bacterium]|nr:transposase [Verrucomicrobiae bacterium]
MKNNLPTVEILPYQLPICPVLPTVYGNVDYTEFEEQLNRIDELLRASGVEQVFVEMSLGQFYESTREAGIDPKIRAHLNYQKHSFRALRCMVLMSLLGESFRGMSRRLAECALFRWFCGMEEIGIVRVASKSTLQAYANWLPAQMMRKVVETFLKAACSGEQPLGLANAMELECVWMDATCVKANIHFPVDWVLLRDATRTLMKATALIRKHGLKERMEEPSAFLSRMNRLSMAMSHCSRWVKDSRKQRKRNLRLMKRLVGVVAAHARRHRELLDAEWARTDWTRKEVEQVLRRMDGVLKLLPLAKKQAHERIIGGRPVKNEDKILSLYEREAQVIVRGKAGAEVEFGNEILLAEQKDGVIVDWRLYRDEVPADCRQLPESLERMENVFGKGRVLAVGTDRGFESSANINLLAEKGIYNGICPKNPRLLRERMKEAMFVKLQKRRGQTEARIGIFKNVFVGRPLRVRGFVHRDAAVAWHVLTHNLWVLARQPKTEEKELAEAA